MTTTRITMRTRVRETERHAPIAPVATVDDLAGLRRQLATCDDHEVVLVERKVVGPEFSVEGLV